MTFRGFGFLLSKVLEGNYDLGEQKGRLQGLRQQLPELPLIPSWNEAVRGLGAYQTCVTRQLLQGTG